MSVNFFNRGLLPALQQDYPPIGARDRLGLPARRALILENDARTATYVGEVLARMQVQTSVARSLLEVGPHVTVPPPSLLVLSLPSKSAPDHLEFASTLRASRGTACVFVLDRVDRAMAAALADIGERSVLCKPIHREQLEATCLLALLQSDRNARQSPAAQEGVQERERRLETTLRLIAEAVATVGIRPVENRFGVTNLPGLRPREEEIVRLLLQHVRVPAIAERLGMTQQTVRNHLKGAFKRTGVRSQQELLDYFTRLTENNRS